MRVKMPTLLRHSSSCCAVFCQSIKRQSSRAEGVVCSGRYTPSIVLFKCNLCCVCMLEESALCTVLVSRIISALLLRLFRRLPFNTCALVGHGSAIL